MAFFESSVSMSPSAFAAELPNMLFGVGFVGSLMGAARRAQKQVSGGDNEGNGNKIPSQSSMRETAEHMARQMMDERGGR